MDVLILVLQIIVVLLQFAVMGGTTKLLTALREMLGIDAAKH